MSTRTLLIALVTALFAVMPAHAARQALVIGNDNYTSVSKLQKAGNDATAMARELKAAGFTVQLHRDLNYRSMVRTVETFTAGIKGGDEVVVFFAGHGVQIKNGAYLLPTDIDATTESEVEKTSYELNALTEKLSDAKAAFSLVMVDACRNNPLPKKQGRSVGNSRGLSAIEPPKGQMVVYSASKGQTALDALSDKDKNPNSVFTREFVARMKKPGLRIEDLMREVQDAVEALAGTVQHEQRPALYNEARGNFYFFGPTTVQVAPTKPETSDAQIEQQAWTAAQSGNTVAGYAAYLEEYPKGRFAAAARVARASLAASAVAQPPAPVKPVQATPPAVQTALATAGQTVKDCSDCPEMVVIPAGSFRMGAPDSEQGRGPREGPVHEVRIGYSFALGKYELTRGEFARFVNVSGYKTEAERSQMGCYGLDSSKFEWRVSKNWRDPGFPQTDGHPVVCVSWSDAQAYLAWLNEKAPGKGFRLPSEAEWEYAARANQGATRFPWGDDLGHNQICDFANGLDSNAKEQMPHFPPIPSSCSDGYAYTAPVGSFKANAFGLYDMHGNALEWMQDIWHDNYQGATSDGSAWINGGEQARRVLRGGGWSSSPRNLRSANRSPERELQFRSSIIGMRIARTN
jgi:formylglycine-generating enzyme required for sulfatase activity